jgi:hypothetical protein
MRRLRYELFSLHIGVERVFAAAIDRFGIFDGLVTLCIGGAAREENGTACRDFQELFLFASGQTSLQFLFGL